MIKVFHMKEDERWNTKWNFVDSRNVLCGYDSSQNCCEHAGFVFTKALPTELGSIDRANIDENTPLEDLEKMLHLDKYIFDTKFFHEHEAHPDCDAGGAVTFKLVPWAAEDELEMTPWYLTLYNCHNGYYGHGFEFCAPEEHIRHHGCL